MTQIPIQIEFFILASSACEQEKTQESEEKPLNCRRRCVSMKSSSSPASRWEQKQFANYADWWPRCHTGHCSLADTVHTVQCLQSTVIVLFWMEYNPCKDQCGQSSLSPHSHMSHSFALHISLSSQSPSLSLISKSSLQFNLRYS